MVSCPSLVVDKPLLMAHCVTVLRGKIRSRKVQSGLPSRQARSDLWVHGLGPKKGPERTPIDRP